MNEVYEEGLLLEREMTELLGELQRAVEGPTFPSGWTRCQRRGGYRCQHVHRLVVLSRANTPAYSRSSFCGIYPHRNPPETGAVGVAGGGIPQTQGEASQTHTCVMTPKVVAPCSRGRCNGRFIN